MSDLEERFKQAADDVQQLSERPSNDDLLELYALFKQATEGDVSGKRPGITSFKKRAKYDAWAEREGMEKDEAMERYIAKVEELQEKIG